MENELQVEKTISFKKEPLWIDSAVGVKVKLEQSEDAHARASVEVIPAQRTKIKQELKPEEYFTDLENFQEPKVEKEFKHEIDIATLKNENILEADNTKFKIEIRRNKFPCPVCKKNYLSCKSRRRHFIKHFRKGLVMCCCGKFFTETILFSRHYFLHFVKKESNIKKCQEFRVHTDSLIENFGNQPSKKSYKCEICLKGFSNSSNLKRHSRIHTGEKPFKCEICLRFFSTTSDLNVHTRTHTRTSEYQCVICLKHVSSKQSLLNHSRIHTGEKPYKCEICSKQFSNSSHLMRHSKIHTGEKPYKCEICSKQFSELSKLTRHSKTHTGEKPYKCEICMKQFSLFSNLTTHSRIHSGEKPYKCEICQKQFSHLSSFTRHSIKIHAGDNPYGNANFV